MKNDPYRDSRMEASLSNSSTQSEKFSRAKAASCRKSGGMTPDYGKLLLALHN